MFRTFLAIGVTCLMCLGFLTDMHASQQNFEYSIVEVMDAVQAGQFRVIYTASTNFDLGSNGQYINAFHDGVYRISDGKHYEQLNNSELSTEGNYAAQENEGVFHLPSESWIIHSETTLVFSNDSAYIAVSEEGVYRLADAQKILHTDSTEIVFSPDSTLVATLDGVFRVTDGQQILDTNQSLAIFSPDSAYAWTRFGSLYRLGDGKEVLEINTPYSVSFTPDMHHVVILGDGVYRVDTGELAFSIEYDGELAYAAIKFSPCGEHVAVEYGTYRINDGQKLFDHDHVTFSPNCTYIVVANDGAYRLDDMQKIFDIPQGGGSATKFSNDESYLALPSDGIYRTANWRRVIESNSGSSPTFSPNTTYVAIDRDGVYRLSSGERLFSIEGSGRMFTSDESHLILLSDESSGIYNLRTRDYYRGIQPLDISKGIMSVGTAIVIIDETVENQSLLYGIITSNNTFGNGSWLKEEPSHDSIELVYIPAGVYLAIIEEQNSWYRVGYDGKSGWILAETMRQFSFPE